MGKAKLIRVAGLAGALCYATLIIWLYQQQPQTMAEVRGGMASAIGAYHVDPTSFDEGTRFFYNDQFVEARAAFGRADPASRDSVTQFYIAYSYYREGWGRLHHDDALYKLGLAAVDRARAVAPQSRVNVSDPRLEMHSADELRAELERGITIDRSDFNPMRLLNTRK